MISKRSRLLGLIGFLLLVVGLAIWWIRPVEIKLAWDAVPGQNPQFQFCIDGKCSFVDPQPQLKDGQWYLVTRVPRGHHRLGIIACSGGSCSPESTIQE